MKSSSWVVVRISFHFQLSNRTLFIFALIVDRNHAKHFSFSLIGCKVFNQPLLLRWEMNDLRSFLHTSKRKETRSLKTPTAAPAINHSLQYNSALKRRMQNTPRNVINMTALFLYCIKNSSWLTSWAEFPFHYCNERTVWRSEILTAFQK